jgi:hypothetical protein
VRGRSSPCRPRRESTWTIDRPGRSTGMTSVRFTSITRCATHTVLDHREHLRLRLKAKAPTTGVVDGGWWPRSRDLATEVPALLAVLAVRPGAVEVVSYHLNALGPTPRRANGSGTSSERRRRRGAAPGLRHALSTMLRCSDGNRRGACAPHMNDSDRPLTARKGTDHGRHQPYLHLVLRSAHTPRRRCLEAESSGKKMLSNWPGTSSM